MKRGTWASLACAGICLGLALRPIDAADRAAAWLVGVLGLPYQALGDAEVMLLGSPLKPDAARAAAADEARAAFLQRGPSYAAAAVQSAGERACAATVISRDLADSTLTIDRGEEDGLVPGMPVVASDALVGVVHRIEARRSVVRVASHPRFRVAARTDADPAMRLVVGGAGYGRARVELSERHDLPGGAGLVVAETTDGSFLDAAAGRRVGVLGLAPEDASDRRPGSKRKMRRVDPDRSVVLDVDADRLLDVAVLAPDGVSMPAPRARAVEAAAQTAAERWERVDLVPSGDPMPSRRTLLARTPRSVVVESGAALALDGWLLGRASRAGGPTLRARLCEDPGFEFDGVLVPAEGPLIRLGALRCAGVEGSALVLQLRGRPGDLPALSDGPLVTGNREREVPPGLLLGWARVDKGRLLVDRPFRGADATSAQLFDVRGGDGR